MAPGNLPVAISLLKNSVMRSSFSGDGLGGSTAHVAAGHPMQAATAVTSRIRRAPDDDEPHERIDAAAPTFVRAPIWQIALIG